MLTQERKNNLKREATKKPNAEKVGNNNELVSVEHLKTDNINIQIIELNEKGSKE